MHDCGLKTWIKAYAITEYRIMSIWLLFIQYSVCNRFQYKYFLGGFHVVTRVSEYFEFAFTTGYLIIYKLGRFTL